MYVCIFNVPTCIFCMSVKHIKRKTDFKFFENAALDRNKNHQSSRLATIEANCHSWTAIINLLSHILLVFKYYIYKSLETHT